MSKRGFTIVEIITVLAIIAVIMVVGFFVANNIVTSNRERAREVLIANIQEQVRSYISTKNIVLPPGGDPFFFSVAGMHNEGFLTTQHLEDIADIIDGVEPFFIEARLVNEAVMIKILSLEDMKRLYSDIINFGDDENRLNDTITFRGGWDVLHITQNVNSPVSFRFNAADSGIYDVMIRSITVDIGTESHTITNFTKDANGYYNFTIRTELEPGAFNSTITIRTEIDTTIIARRSIQVLPRGGGTLTANIQTPTGWQTTATAAQLFGQIVPNGAYAERFTYSWTRFTNIATCETTTNFNHPAGNRGQVTANARGNANTRQFTEDGCYRITVVAHRGARSSEPVTSGPLKIGRTAPTNCNVTFRRLNATGAILASSAPTVTNNNLTWFNGNIHVTASGSSTIGMRNTRIEFSNVGGVGTTPRTNCPDNNTLNCTGSIEANGRSTARAICYDQAGNRTVGAWQHIGRDVIAPTCTMSLTRIDNGANHTFNTWSTVNLRVTANSTDAHSGVVRTEIEHQVGNNTTTNGSNAASHSRDITAEGTTRVRTRCQDRAGNWSTWSAWQDVRISRSAPTNCAVTFRRNTATGTILTSSAATVTNNNLTWFNGNIHVTASGSSTIGMRNTRIEFSNVGGVGTTPRTNCPDNNTLNCTGSIEANGRSTARAICYDIAGNRTVGAWQHIGRDTAAPTCTMSLTRISNGASQAFNTWSNANLRVTANSTDAHSGVVRTEIEHQVGNNITNNGSNAATHSRDITNEGTTQVRPRCQDRAGNVTVGAWQNVRIDRTPPTQPTLAPRLCPATGTCTWQTATNYVNNTWVNRGVFLWPSNSNSSIINFGSTDSLSGISHFEISQTSATAGFIRFNYDSTNQLYFMTQSGTFNRWIRAVDNAGNIGPARHHTIRIDRSAPTVPTIRLTNQVNDTARTPGDNAWFREPMRFTGTCTDAHSGVGGMEMERQGRANTSATWVNHSTHIHPSSSNTIVRNINANGQSRVRARCRDNVGNWSAWSNWFVVGVDTANPTVTFRLTNQVNNTARTIGIWHPENMSLTATCADAHSGVVTTETERQQRPGRSGDWLNHSTHIHSTNNASHSRTINYQGQTRIRARCTDRAGNRSPWSDWQRVYIDRTTPTVSCGNRISFSTHYMVPITLRSTGPSRIRIAVPEDAQYRYRNPSTPWLNAGNNPLNSWGAAPRTNEFRLNGFQGGWESRFRIRATNEAGTRGGWTFCPGPGETTWYNR